MLAEEGNCVRGPPRLSGVTATAEAKAAAIDDDRVDCKTRDVPPSTPTATSPSSTARREISINDGGKEHVQANIRDHE